MGVQKQLSSRSPLLTFSGSGCDKLLQPCQYFCQKEVFLPDSLSMSTILMNLLIVESSAHKYVSGCIFLFSCECIFLNDTYLRDQEV